MLWRHGLQSRRFFRVAALAALLTPACGSNPAGPSSVPDIRGTYSGNGAWTTTFTSPRGDYVTTSQAYFYGGRVVVDGQAGSEFSGSFSIEGTASGAITRGTVEADGAVSFELPDPEGGPHPGTDVWSETCSLLHDSVAYTGRVNGATLEANRSLTYSCPNAGILSLSVRFSGRK